jgi:hypothetical protein
MSASLAALCSAALVGCGGVVTTGGGGGGGCTPRVGSNAPASCPSRAPVAGVSFSGKVMAAAKPVVGASVQLYAAGNSGNGSGSAPLLTAPLTTAADGSFSVPAGYICPSAQTPVYLLSKGGQPASAASPNSSLWLMTALGPCGSVNSGSSFAVNEVTTAASVWALASFMSAGGIVGASCTNTTGLDNAFTTANELVNAATGASPGAGLPSTLTVPTTKLNTLANALASCSASAGGSACSPLFNAATSSAAPASTLDAALNIARAPANNEAAIYSLAAGSGVFSPVLAAAPPDWMLHNTLSGGGMDSPASVAVDASGNVWASSYFNAVSEFSPDGATTFPAGITGSGINESYGMALDVQGNVWIANEQTTSNSGNGNVTELNSSGQAIATGITSGGIYFPLGVAADPNGDMWFADYGDSKVTLLSSSGAAISSSAGWGGTCACVPCRIGRRRQSQRLGRKSGRPASHHLNLRGRLQGDQLQLRLQWSIGRCHRPEGQHLDRQLLRQQHQRSRIPAERSNSMPRLAAACCVLKESRSTERERSGLPTTRATRSLSSVARPARRPARFFRPPADSAPTLPFSIHTDWQSMPAEISG